MSAPTIEKVITLIEEATQSPPGLLEPDTALEDFSGWDSMGIVTLFALVQTHFDVKLRAADMESFSTPAALTEKLVSLTVK